MMTAIVVLSSADLDDEVVVSPVAAAVPGGKLGLLAGERWSVHELLQALLVASSNDAAVALAEHVAGSETSFVEAMNRRAARLGLEATSFTTSHGLDAEGHSSSAADLATLAAELLDSPVLAEIVDTSGTTIESSERATTIENTNLLLETYPGADGVKTGFTALAGNVLVASAERYGRRLIAVAMHSADAFTDAAALLDFGFRKLRRGILLADETVQDAIVSDAGAVSAVAAQTVRGPELPESVRFSFQVSPGLSLPIREGEVIGLIHVEDEDGGILDSVPATSSGSLSAPPVDWRRELIEDVLAAAGNLLGE
jgi:D-alanyl-D-alanine carboxypeptidase (penicillin-binding protein 5/6)